MILSTHGKAWSTKMRPFICAVALLLIAPFAAADPLDPLIDAYQAYVNEANPAEAARAAGTTPSAWGTVTPQAVAERAGKAMVLRSEIES